jgi:DNA gyrase/topoisomerase IV subunit A
MTCSQEGGEVIALSAGASVVGFLVFDPQSEQFFVLVTSDGFVLRVRASEFYPQVTGSFTAQKAISLSKPKSKLCCALLVPGDAQLRASTRNSNLKFSAGEIPLQSPSDKGIRLLDLPAGRERFSALLPNDSITGVAVFKARNPGAGLREGDDEGDDENSDDDGDD